MKPKHGGKRAGAGRKPIHGERKQMTSMRLTQAVLAYLAQCDESVAETVEKAMRRTGAYRRWRAGNIKTEQ